MRKKFITNQHLELTRHIIATWIDDILDEVSSEIIKNCFLKAFPFYKNDMI